MPRTLDGLLAVDYEQITVAGTAVGLTQSKYDRVPPVIGAVITVTTAPIRWMQDGTVPTATTGYFAVPTGPEPVILMANLPKFKAIRQSLTSATIEVQYFGAG